MIAARFAYGFWRYGRDEMRTAISAIETARELGVTHFDTADCYGEGAFGDAECMLGDIRQAAPSLFDGAEIATKAGVEFGAPYNSSPAYLERAIDASLGRLGVECVDLFYIHRPDFLTHPEDVAAVLDGIVAAGKAKAIGVSNYSPLQLAALRAYLKAPLSAHQVEFSAMHVAPVADGVFDQAMASKITAYAWSPLAGGALLTGGSERATRVRTLLLRHAEAAGVSIAAAALAFVAAHPAAPIPILGSKNPDRIREAIAACRVSFSRQAWYEIYEASIGEKLP